MLSIFFYVIAIKSILLASNVDVNIRSLRVLAKASVVLKLEGSAVRRESEGTNEKQSLIICDRLGRVPRVCSAEFDGELINPAV